MPHRIAKRPTKVRPIKAPKTLELKFDPEARQDYLTGFHKRKQARIQAARDVAIQRDREDRVRERRELREKRKEDLESHIVAVRKEMRRQNRIIDGDASEIENDDEDVEDDEEGWAGIDNLNTAVPQVVPVEDEAEYTDEDKYTTVTVEPLKDESDEEADAGDARQRQLKTSHAQKRVKSKLNDGRPKTKKKKFRYESKAERSLTRHKQKNKNRKQAEARKSK